MGRSVVSEADADKLILEQGVGRESIKIARDAEQQRRLDDFYLLFVQPDQLQFFDRQSKVTGVYAFAQYSGVSRAGTMVHVRHKTYGAGETNAAPQTIVVVGSLQSDETLTISDVYCDEPQSDYYGGRVERIYLDDPAMAPDARVTVNGFLHSEVLAKENEQYEQDGTTPCLVFERGKLSYERHDGVVEPMSDLKRVHGEVVALTRHVGLTGLKAVEGIKIETQETGQLEQKVVA